MFFFTRFDRNDSLLRSPLTLADVSPNLAELLLSRSASLWRWPNRLARTLPAHAFWSSYDPNPSSVRASKTEGRMIRVPAEAVKNINAVASGQFNQAAGSPRSEAFLCRGV